MNRNAINPMSDDLGGPPVSWAGLREFAERHGPGELKVFTLDCQLAEHL